MKNKSWFRFWDQLAVSVKLTLAVSILISLGVVSLTALSIQREEETFRAGLENQAEVLLAGLEAAAAEIFDSQSPRALLAFTGGVEGGSTIISVTFFDLEGRVVDPEVGLTAAGDTAPDPFGSLIRRRGGVVYQWYPDRLLAGKVVWFGNQSEGAIGIELATGPLQEKIAELRSQSVLLALVAIAVGVLMTTLLSWSITTPLQELLMATRRVVDGEQPGKITPNQGDEVAELAASFEEMSAAMEQSSARKGAILAAAPIGILSFEISGEIIEINPAAQTMFGYPGEEALGRNIDELVSLSTPSEASQTGFTVLLAEGLGEDPDLKINARALRKDGSQIAIEIAATEVSGYSPRLFTALVRDITERLQANEAVRQAHETLERKVAERTADLETANQTLVKRMADLERAEQALRDREEQFSLATQGANDGLWDWDNKTNRAYFSARWKAILGHQPGEIDGHIDAWFQRVHPDDLEEVKAELAAHLNGLNPHFESEHRMLHKGGQYLWVLSRGLAVRDSTGTVCRMAGSLTDITERKQVEKQLVHDAFHDTLTGLPNRALFLDRLGRAIERTKRRPENLFGVLFLDLDRFKVINDSLGHTIGDQLLIAMARRLEVFLRSVDTVARLGGDEFVILLEDIRDLADATRVAARIQDELALPFFPNEHKVFTSVSTGIVLSSTGYNRPEEILRDADIAMYRAKARGRARYEVFDTEMRAQAIARLELETDLRRAIGYQEFQIYYQPIVSLENNRIIGFEALVRWQHPTRGLIYPEEFIPVAEETGLIVPIDWWMLHNACQQLAVWQKQYPDDPPLTISVNVSPKHFANLDLVQQVENILQATGLEARSLKLEITESVFMETDDVAQEAFAQLRNMGIQLQIDDFGTGYSSLGYLQRFPVDTIKIDRSFVSKMDGHATNSEIVRTIVRLARELNMEAIAEGVETREQFDQLKDLECGFGQGFLISKPMDRRAAEKLIKKTRTQRSKAS